ncbi:MAG: universal stress protein [Pseudomonadota bacterium]
MSIKNILVSFNGTDRAKQAVKLAAALARRYDAHLSCVFAHAVPYTSIQVQPYLTEAALEQLNDGFKDSENRCKAEFEEIVDQQEQGVRTSFICEMGFPNAVIAKIGRAYDLIVIAQPDDDATPYNDTFPDDVALKSGRPVMIAPISFEMFELGRGAVLAWDGERAAARALSDAMDLLEDKQKITVLHVGKEEDVRKPGHDVLEHLSRHGISAKLNVQPPGGIKTADIILNTCAETDAGLLVMGAYEHSRFSEILLGGITRDVVAKSHIPVLMSH